MITETLTHQYYISTKEEMGMNELPYQQNILNLPLHKVRAKPGRKPSPLEPANKRLAQNRIAQRAYRERKENHLRYLEERVVSLEMMNKEQSNLIRQLQGENHELCHRLHNNNMNGSSNMSSSHSGISSPLKDEFTFYNANVKVPGCTESFASNEFNSNQSVRLPGIDALLRGSPSSDEDVTLTLNKIWH